MAQAELWAETSLSATPLQANKYVYLNFAALDANGQSRADEIQAFSGNYAELDIVDESLTTFLRSDFINRRNLQFSVNFPKAGKYKAFFSFRYANQLQQIAFVLDVK